MKPMPLLTRRRLTLAAASWPMWPVFAQAPNPGGLRPNPAWAAIESRARGQRVFFNAWGGSERVNGYLQWAATQMQSRYGVQVEHVKLTDSAEAVRRVRNEKAAQRTEGSVDAMWINGENFLAMKRESLLFGPFAESLPNFGYVDVQGKPTTRMDFGEPTEGFESPWGMAQFTVFADGARLPAAQRPQNMTQLLALARAQPGRITYARPPAFMGTTVLKQALLELTPDRTTLYQPHSAERFASATAPLWTYLDALHPHLWRAGKQFAVSPAAIRQMVSDGELLLGATFNPNETANEIAARRLLPSYVAWQFEAGTVGNTHFIAIAFNARAKEAAQVWANFLLSPEAQAHKADIAVWGDPTVLALDRLTATERARFTANLAPGQVERTAPVWPEPHASWVDPIEREWTRRYGV
jgi:putative thiamine transport system substrate-binding protein